jgi:hypothetical protein
MQELRSGHLLIAFSQRHQIVEFDRAGKTVWSLDVERPGAAIRLTNGNTLVAQENGGLLNTTRKSKRCGLTI